MTEVQKAIQAAFDVLRQISVKDTDVERMAMAKGHLARAYQLEEKQDE